MRKETVVRFPVFFLVLYPLFNLNCFFFVQVTLITLSVSPFLLQIPANISIVLVYQLALNYPIGNGNDAIGNAFSATGPSNNTGCSRSSVNFLLNDLVNEQRYNVFTRFWLFF